MRKAMRSALLVCVAIGAMAMGTSTASAWTPEGSTSFEGEVHFYGFFDHMDCQMNGSINLEGGESNQGTVTEIGLGNCEAHYPSYYTYGCSAEMTLTEGGYVSADAEASTVSIEGLQVTMTYHGPCYANKIALHLAGSIGGEYHNGELVLDGSSLIYQNEIVQGTAMSIDGTLSLAGAPELDLPFVE